MGRKCSHCGNIGHNSRTCNASKMGGGGGGGGGGVMKLFGVHIYISSNSSSNSNCVDDNKMKKSFSLDCLSATSSSSSSSRFPINENSDTSLGYLSDAPPHERKKGVPWTEEEHRSFLIGLEMVGKGDWRGISRNYVPTRTPTQVASHAQKYFLRLSTLDNKKRRSSLFDIVGAKKDIPESSCTNPKREVHID